MNIIIALLLNALALIITAYIVPGFHVASFTTAILAGIVLSIVNTFIKPVLLILTAPLTIITLGLFAFIVNAVVLMIVAALVTGFKLDGWIPAILGAIVLSIVSTALSMLAKDLEGKKAK